MSNSLGKMFTVTSFGESHGRCMGAVVDGCPAGLSLEPSDIQHELDRRRPGQSGVTTARREGDDVEILSGVFNDRTTQTGPPTSGTEASTTTEEEAGSPAG